MQVTDIDAVTDAAAARLTLTKVTQQHYLANLEAMVAADYPLRPCHSPDIDQEGQEHKRYKMEGFSSVKVGQTHTTQPCSAAA